MGHSARERSDRLHLLRLEHPALADAQLLGGPLSAHCGDEDLAHHPQQGHHLRRPALLDVHHLEAQQTDGPALGTQGDPEPGERPDLLHELALRLRLRGESLDLRDRDDVSLQDLSHVPTELGDPIVARVEGDRLDAVRAPFECREPIGLRRLEVQELAAVGLSELPDLSEVLLDRALSVLDLQRQEVAGEVCDAGLDIEPTLERRPAQLSGSDVPHHAGSAIVPCGGREEAQRYLETQGRSVGMVGLEHHRVVRSICTSFRQPLRPQPGLVRIKNLREGHSLEAPAFVPELLGEDGARVEDRARLVEFEDWIPRVFGQRAEALLALAELRLGVLAAQGACE